jgi:hypothetical protein
VVGQATRNTSFNWDYEDVGVAVILASESDHRSIGREKWIRLGSSSDGQAIGDTPFSRDFPEVAGILKNDVILIGSWLLKKGSRLRLSQAR